MNSQSNPCKSDESSYSDNIKDKTFMDLENEINIFFEKYWITNYEIPDYISNAYCLAVRLHDGQKRKTWEDYVQHPLRVAISAIKNFWTSLDIEVFYETIAVALLHDIIEDTYFTEKDLENYFWKTISKSVSLLSKKPWKNFITDDDFIKINPNKAKIEWKELRDEDYKKVLIWLKERKFWELGMNNFTEEEKEQIRKIVLVTKWIDRIDNLSTMKNHTPEQISRTIEQTQTSIINLLGDFPAIIKYLNITMFFLI